MSQLKSMEAVTSVTGPSQALSPPNSSNDKSTWSTQASSGQPIITNPRSFSNSTVASAGGDRQGASKGDARTYQAALQSGQATLNPSSAAPASLLPPVGKNYSSSTLASDTRSQSSKAPDITLHQPHRSASLSPPSAPVGPSSSAGLLRVDVALPAQKSAPTPPPKSPRHSPFFGRSASADTVPVLPTAMGSGQSKRNLPTPLSAPSHQRQKQQHLQLPNAHAASTSSSTRGISPSPQLSPPSARKGSPSPQPSQTFASRSLSPVMTSAVSQPLSSSNGQQPSTPTSMAGSLGNGATKLMRKFARRKKSEDVSTLFSKAGQGRNGSGSGPSHKGSHSMLDGSGKDTRATQARSPSPVGQPSSAYQQMSSPPPLVSSPPPITKKPSPLPIPPSYLPSSNNLDLPTSDYTVHTNHNRTSLITLSPNISSAVNFMRTLPTSPDGPVKVAEERVDGSRGPINSAPIPPSSAPAATTSHPASPVKENSEPREGKTSSEIKESWRKSDSTIGHNTIRQGANGNTRTSRPVSMAESFQSAYTVVPSAPSSSTGGGNKRWSTLTADMDFGVMVEEPGEDVEDEVRQPKQPAPVIAGSSSLKTSPVLSAKQQNRRSVSLNVGIIGSGTAQVAPSFVHATGKAHIGHEAAPLSYSASESSTLPTSTPKQHYQHPSFATKSRDGHSSSALTHHLHADNNVSHPGQQNMTSTGGLYRPLPALDKDPRHQSNQSLDQMPGASATNIRARFPGWSNSQSRNSSAPPSAMPPLSNSAYSHGPVPPRQPTISLTNSLAPAAGLAKQAAKKLGGIGKKWGLNNSSSGSGYSSSASSRDPVWSSSQSQLDHGQGMPLGRTNSNQSSLASSMKSGTTSLSSGFGEIVHRVQLPSRNKDKKSRRTPNAPSGAYSMTSSVTSTSTSESDAFFPSSGPVLGVMVRGPLKRQGMSTSGVVFGRDLRMVVNDTLAVIVSNLDKDAESKVGGEREHLVREVQQRKLPALVTRCAQHLLIWGVQEEGLFRVSGRASHIGRLRSEFDTGVDYDMTSCNPGDLDPHAVASIFKAYLRELPEPILTKELHPLFEAAVTQELEDNPPGAMTQSRVTTRQPGLPSSPKAAMTMPIRKPPSLSTLAMPSFNGMPPASKTLVNTLRSLISQLPDENRDLIRTVVQLMKATYQASKDTKMPLSNLLLVFCPSLNMSPPLLKALCETEDIWDPTPEDPEPEQVLNIKRDTIIVDTRSTDRSEDTFDEGNSAYLGDELEVQSAQSAPSEQPSSESRESIQGSPLFMDETPSRPPIPTIYLDSHSHCSSSSLSSIQELEVPSTGSSIPSPPPLSSSAESVVTPTSSSGHPSLPHLPMSEAKPSVSRKSSANDLLHPCDGVPVVVRLDDERRTASEPAARNDSGPVDFPSSPPVPAAQRRRSLALLSLSTFSTVSSPASGDPEPNDSVRGKKPSLRRLFTKRSTASLSSNHSGANSAISRARSSAPLQYSPGVLTFTPPTPQSASDSSVSTPISAVTAQSSTSILPPVLDLPIPTETSLAFDLGFDVDDDDLRLEHTPGTARTEGTFFASALTSQVSLYGQAGEDIKLPLSPYTRQRLDSTVSNASSNHLGMLDDEDDDWTSTVLAAACAGKI